MDVTNLINGIIGNTDDSIWSTADISYSKFKETYSRAIIVAQKYDEFITNDDYDEQKYHSIMTTIRINLDQKMQILKESFDNLGISNYIPPATQTDEVSLLAPFSFKYAAVQAGLGWIGKSGVLITRKFGPRVRLAAILIDYSLECGKPVNVSYCGNCHVCIEACPWEVIRGNTWSLLTKRDELLDYQLCNSKRSEYIKITGRKHTCGHCILACPWGTKMK